ncbi:Cd2+/Zn2+-exporting ATPase [Gracilibacillus halotolerans]|uniref:Cd(2+)-exporting ATPase n=1 Tax=Gracilibacillus halotolerans TaxID=74386 RepID=A0A841RH19_9BACI|nr:heavy metal translocating P-type ATPase [Gracilibacillus halotolerans]MBB6513450.1 Cd2+/Zn2+-exporting ATPase [Gracilibacillus halotolerans]
MSELMEKEMNTYRVQGLSCTNCAATFENNVKELPGVKDAKVNFGASKIYVQGNTTIEEIEKAGAFENLKIRGEKERQIKRVPFWKQRETIKVYIAALILIISALYTGEHSVISTIGYGLSIVIGGYTLFIRGLENLAKVHFDMNTLMTIAIIGAVIIGEWLEGATVVILFAISEALEKYSMDKARQSIESLMDLSPKEALVRRNNQEQHIAVEDIRVNDVVIVKPGEQLPMDGIIIEGSSTINQATITGESLPVARDKGEEVFAGTLNGEGLLEIRVTKRVEDTTLAKIIHLVEEAQAERAPSQQFVDKFAKYYTPLILVIALLIAVIPPLFFGGVWMTWIYQGLAVLVVGCPCALVVSTPVAVVTAIGNAAKQGVLIKGGVYLEEMGRVKAIAFDKTGTLTKGKPTVTDSIVWNGEEKELLSVTAAMEQNTTHPLATSIVEEANRQGIHFESIEVKNFQSLTGKGVKATVDGTEYFIGSPNLFRDIIGSIPSQIEAKITQLQDEGKTVISLGTKQELLLTLALADEIRETAREVIASLNERQIETVMLTGDNRKTAEAIGIEAGISTVQSDLLPEDKLSVIKKLRSQYKQVAMVGDGVNDAPALASSNVGIAMGGAGTDTALETADIALMSDDLRQLPYTIQLSRRALSIIKQNITFALGIKIVALLLVIPGWLTLWIAIAADMGATLLVTLNSMRLLKVKNK